MRHIKVLFITPQTRINAIFSIWKCWGQLALARYLCKKFLTPIRALKFITFTDSLQAIPHGQTRQHPQLCGFQPQYQILCKF